MIYKFKTILEGPKICTKLKSGNKFLKARTKSYNESQKSLHSICFEIICIKRKYVTRARVCLFHLCYIIQMKTMYPKKFIIIFFSVWNYFKQNGRRCIILLLDVWENYRLVIYECILASCTIRMYHKCIKLRISYEILLYSSGSCTSTAVKNKNKISCAGYRSNTRDTWVFDKI